MAEGRYIDCHCVLEAKFQLHISIQSMLTGNAFVQSDESPAFTPNAQESPSEV